MNNIESKSRERNNYCSTYQPNTILVTCVGAVATEPEEKKKQKYCNLSATYCFIPVAVESAGAFGQDATRPLSSCKNLADALLLQLHGDPRVTEFLFQRLSVAVQRGNAACVLGTFVLTAAVTIFYCLIIVLVGR